MMFLDAASAPDAQAALNTPPPDVDTALAGAIARDQYGFSAAVTPLSGERDANFLAVASGGERAVLKCIGAAETAAETAFQIAALRHLAASPASIITPRHIATLAGDDLALCADRAGQPLRARAYRFLEGRPAARATPSRALRRALGAALALFNQSLTDFDHPGIHRTFLWNIMDLAQLQPLTHYVSDTESRGQIDHFIDAFAYGIAPAVAPLRPQAVHSDLSKSNYVVAARDDTMVAGIIDFGDMSHAPLVCDLAIASSYQMSDTDDPVEALDDMRAGFEPILPLTADEAEHLLDLVLARVVQRLVITEWRAALFPENREYILRFNPQARALFTRLYPLWRERSRHA